MTDTLNGRVAANLRAELTRRSLTQEQFAEQAQIGRTTMQALLAGRVGISLHRLDLFARLLSVEPSKLLND
jgi:transcriptional regulator with XRE-family HTH domain